MSSFLPKTKSGKLDLKPKRHHGYYIVLFIFGTLFPPLAVAARFGIGTDFWINLLLTICGYIPGHAHNFYIQNIRNNKNRKRTPKWAVRYGLVDDSDIKRKESRSQWANRYKERNPHSTLEGQPYEEDQVGPSRSEPSLASTSGAAAPRGDNGGALWNENEEQYYNPPAAESGGGRWKYPANFDDTEVAAPVKKKKKDRWARQEDAHRGVYDDALPSRRKSKKKRAAPSRVDEEPDRSSGLDRTVSEESSAIIPEDPTGMHYGQSRRAADPAAAARQDDDELFNHQF